MPDQPDRVRGPRVFTYLAEIETAWLPEARRDEVALAVRRAVTADP